MKPAPFEYHRPSTSSEAVELLAGLDDAKVLAGGQSLIPMLALRLTVFGDLVDIGRIAELDGIRRDWGVRGESRPEHGRTSSREAGGPPSTGAERGVRGESRPPATPAMAAQPAAPRSDTSVWIGAGTTQATVERSAEVADAVPLLHRATRYIGHIQIRSRGTVGGSLAHADPAAEYPAVALALDAGFEALSPRGPRTIPAGEFFTGMWSTSLDDDEILTGVTFPVWSGRCGFAIEEVARRHGDFAMAGAVVGVQVSDDDRVERCGIGLIGLGSQALRATEAEGSVIGVESSDVDPEEVGRAAVADLDNVPADIHGSAAYRSRIGAATVQRALTKAIEEATRG